MTSRGAMRLPDDLQRQLNQIIERFKDFWKRKPRPDISDFLPRDDQLRFPVLCELVHVDLDHRVEIGEVPTTAEYLSRFPELSSATEFVGSLNEAIARHARNGGSTNLDATLLTKNVINQEDVALSPERAEGGPHRAAPDPSKFAFDKANLSSRYELIEEIGRGGMGVIFRGRHQLLGLPIAVKFQMLTDGIERFQREAQVLASIRSPHVVAVQDFEIMPSGQAMLVMQWISGSDLSKLLRSATEPFDEERVISWMLQVCEGMQAAAEQGIVHRDLKPSNIMIDDADKAYVTDFGLARSSHRDVLTHTGGLMGTPHYMAPEQAEDPRAVDTRADIYSFGATFYQVVTRYTPFSGESWFSILLNHKTASLVSPKSRNPSISTRLNDCIERCLAKLPRDRFQSFADIAAYLRPGNGTMPAWDASDDSEIAQHIERYRSRKLAYLHHQSGDLTIPDKYLFPNQRSLTVGFGNLVEQRVDALVSSDDELLSMGAGVSAQLCRVAGGNYAHVARLLTPVRPGRAVATPAGSLPARLVLHGITMGQWSGSWINPSRDILNEIMESCFYLADTHGVRSIAFPLLGTGAGQFPREVCLDTMFRFLARKFTHGLTTVQQARIVLYKGR